MITFPDWFFNTWGIPKLFSIDQVKEAWDGEWEIVRMHYLITQKTTEPHSKWKNMCEFKIGMDNKWSFQIKLRFQVLDALWV